ncbi:MAG: tRNA (adenosine(37)-N6)-threonylcarbamoyltransferase complex dimerization subunit type 1 TsaB [Pseudomonadota bacterium]
MNLLGLDTSTPACSVALAVGDTITEQHRESDQRHSREILAMIDALLGEAELMPRDLDAIAFGRGPGSFTGVRLGVSVAQGLGVALDLPLVPVSSLAAVAQGALRIGNDDIVSVAQDARMGEAYAGRYQRDGAVAVPLDAERVCAPGAVDLQPGDVLAGDGWQRIAELAERAGGRTALARWPHAGDLLALARPLLRAGATVRAEDATASYLRDSVVR